MLTLVGEKCGKVQQTGDLQLLAALCASGWLLVVDRLVWKGHSAPLSVSEAVHSSKSGSPAPKAS